MSKIPPPGNHGFPLIGESIEFLNTKPHIFLTERLKRYGEVFSSHLFGQRNIFTTSCDAAKVFLNSPVSKKLCSSKLVTFENLIGSDQINQADGPVHARYRRIILSSMGPEVLKLHVKNIDNLAVDMVDKWEAQDVVHLVDEIRRFTYHVITGFVSTSKETLSLMEDTAALDRGLMQFPLNIPFTPYNRALQAKKRLHKFLDELIEERRGLTVQPLDLLGAFLNDRDDNGNPLSNKQIEENILTCLFAGYHTTTGAIAWLMKYLHDNPECLEEVQKEQMDLLQNKASEDYRLTWEDTRNMPATLRAIHETLRLSNIVGIVFRSIGEDIEYGGYHFPKGWQLKVGICTTHLDEQYYPNPLKFDPSRFQIPPKPGTYFAFGSGNRSCPGSELAKLEMLVFVHRLVTKYSWSPVNPNEGTKYWSVPTPDEGYRIRVRRLRQ